MRISNIVKYFFFLGKKIIAFDHCNVTETNKEEINFLILRNYIRIQVLQIYSLALI